jgi:hypothetical protein
MEHLIELPSRFITVFFAAISGVFDAATIAVSWPAGVLGIPPAYLVAAIACGLLVALWRAMAGQRRSI